MKITLAAETRIASVMRPYQYRKCIRISSKESSTVAFDVNA